MLTSKPATIDRYIAAFPKDVQKMMQQIRETIKKTAPEAEEKISYAMPAFTLKGQDLVYFAGYENHIGFYPAPAGVEAFKKDLSGYKTGKASIQFPLDKPMPMGLITKIVKYRIKQNLEKAKAKK